MARKQIERLREIDDAAEQENGSLSGRSSTCCVSQEWKMMRRLMLHELN